MRNLMIFVIISFRQNSKLRPLALVRCVDDLCGVPRSNFGPILSVAEIRTQVHKS